MVTSGSPDSSILMTDFIDLSLKRLLELRKDINAYLATQFSAPGRVLSDVTPDTKKGKMLRMIQYIEEQFSQKRTLNSEKVFQLVLQKAIKEEIEEMVKIFTLHQQREKELMLLIERLKTHQKDSQALQDLEDDLNKIKELEALQRIELLIMLSMMQSLDEQYVSLEAEHEKAFQSFVDDMIHTLKDVKKADGSLLTDDERRAVNIGLAEEEMALFRELSDEHDKASGNKKINHLLNKINHRATHPYAHPHSHNDTKLLFYKITKENEEHENNTMHHITTNMSKFRERIVNFLHQNGMDPDQAHSIAKQRTENMQQSDHFHQLANILKEKKRAMMLKMALRENHQAIIAQSPLRAKRGHLMEQLQQRARSGSVESDLNALKTKNEHLKRPPSNLKRQAALRFQDVKQLGAENSVKALEFSKQKLERRLSTSDLDTEQPLQEENTTTTTNRTPKKS